MLAVRQTHRQTDRQTNKQTGTLIAVYVALIQYITLIPITRSI